MSSEEKEKLVLTKQRERDLIQSLSHHAELLCVERKRALEECKGDGGLMSMAKCHNENALYTNCFLFHFNPPRIAELLDYKGYDGKKWLREYNMTGIDKFAESIQARMDKMK